MLLLQVTWLFLTFVMGNGLSWTYAGRTGMESGPNTPAALPVVGVCAGSGRFWHGAGVVFATMTID
jgi:hypothetical protein